MYIDEKDKKYMYIDDRDKKYMYIDDRVHVHRWER